MNHTHRHGKRHRRGERLEHGASPIRGEGTPTDTQPEDALPRLELVLVSDTVGTLDAVEGVVRAVAIPGVKVEVIHTAVGAVSKSDLAMAATGSRLVLGFNVELNPQVAEEARGHGVEVRLYTVIYHLGRDLEEIARSLVPREATEEVTCRAKVIKLFKSSRKDIILGCEVERGSIKRGDRYRVVTVAGTAHEGTADSIHIAADVVSEAHAGQQFGLKVSDFQEARVGDLVEVFRVHRPHHPSRWAPRAGVRRID
jgi:translation initiation factor IF-2